MQGPGRYHVPCFFHSRLNSTVLVCIHFLPLKSISPQIHVPILAMAAGFRCGQGRKASIWPPYEPIRWVIRPIFHSFVPISPVFCSSSQIPNSKKIHLSSQLSNKVLFRTTVLRTFYPHWAQLIPSGWSKDVPMPIAILPGWGQVDIFDALSPTHRTVEHLKLDWREIKNTWGTRSCWTASERATRGLLRSCFSR